MSTAIEKIPPQREMAITPMSMLQLAVEQGADIKKLSKLMDLHDRWEKNEARKAFVAAMAAFKHSSIRIVKDKENVQYSKGQSKAMYVSLGNLVNTVTPFLSDHGLSVRWDIDQSQSAFIRIACIVTHSMGHSESVSMVCPPDKSGSKSPIQEIKSAITYGKACTFESICGLASIDGNLDDDGNAGARLPEEVITERLEWIRGSNNPTELQKVFAAAYKDAAAAGDTKTMAAYIKAKDEKREAFRANT